MAERGLRSWVEVSRSRLAANFRAVRELVGPAVEVMPVVKADAYRHGAVEVSRVLEAEGARWLAVSSVEEGVALRQAGIQARILVMAGLLPSEREALLEFALTPALHSLDEVAALDRLGASRNTRLPYHLKIDTGLGRLGARALASHIVEAVGAARNAELEGLMTHFASAAFYDTEQTAEQIANFEKIHHSLSRAGLAPHYRHLAATIPIAYGRRESWGNMVRPGHAIYGYVSPVRGPAPPRQLNVKPVLTWKATVLEVKDLPAGTPVGYGAMFRTRRPTRMAVLAVGYADGLPHRLSNRGHVIAAGRKAPILGAISMDLTSIDATDCPELRPGDPVTLIGEECGEKIDAQQIARTAGTISYAVLCGISVRVRRIYV